MARKPKTQPSTEAAAAAAAVPAPGPVVPDEAPAPVRRGRKPKQRAGAEAAALLQDTAAEQAGATTNSSSARLEQAASVARWDRATDVVRFDWPAIERVAARGGPNQGMAKLLVAARAGGAGSRWPF